MKNKFLVMINGLSEKMKCITKVDELQQDTTYAKEGLEKTTTGRPKTI